MKKDRHELVNVLNTLKYTHKKEVISCVQFAEVNFLFSLIHTGVALIAKFCVKIACFGCRMHFSHVAASPYAK